MAFTFIIKNCVYFETVWIPLGEPRVTPTAGLGFAPLGTSPLGG